jgi:hypothetical protein
METLTIVIALALSTGSALAQVLPQPKPGSPGGSCPFGYTSSGAFCIPSQGAQTAVPLPLNGSCPWGWTRKAQRAAIAAGLLAELLLSCLLTIWRDIEPSPISILPPVLARRPFAKLEMLTAERL